MKEKNFLEKHCECCGYEVTIDTKIPWDKSILLALLKKYNIKAYRYKGQRKTIINFKTDEKFYKNTFSPEHSKFLGIFLKSVNSILKDLIEIIQKN
jgi:hypothetical protein